MVVYKVVWFLTRSTNSDKVMKAYSIFRLPISFRNKYALYVHFAEFISLELIMEGVKAAIAIARDETEVYKIFFCLHPDILAKLKKVFPKIKGSEVQMVCESSSTFDSDNNVSGKMVKIVDDTRDEEIFDLLWSRFVSEELCIERPGLELLSQWRTGWRIRDEEQPKIGDIYTLEEDGIIKAVLSTLDLPQTNEVIFHNIATRIGYGGAGKTLLRKVRNQDGVVTAKALLENSVPNTLNYAVVGFVMTGKVSGVIRAPWD